MDEIRWFNPSQPDTLRNAVFLGYLEAVLTLLRLGSLSALSNIPAPILFLACAAMAAGSVGCASERKAGYALAVGGTSVAVLAYAIQVLRAASFTFALIPFMFAGALLWLLLHEQTRAYQRVWFR